MHLDSEIVSGDKKEKEIASIHFFVPVLRKKKKKIKSLCPNHWNRNFITNKNEEIKCSMLYTSNQTSKIHDPEIFKSKTLKKSSGFVFWTIFANISKYLENRRF